MIHIIDRTFLDTVTSQANESPRRRKNANLHKSHEAPCQRLLNAIEPDSYIRPHRHLDPDKEETLVILRGRLGVIEFSASGAVLVKRVLAPGSDAVAVSVCPGTFHTFISLESGTVFFEAKAGPYVPISAEEFAPWAPEEGSPDATAYLEALRKLWQ